MPSKTEISASASTSEANSKRTNRMLKAWDFLVRATKHRSRFFFHSLSEHKDDSPQKVLRTVRHIFSSFGMIRKFSVGDVLYRARHYDGSWPTSDPLELLAPSPDKACAGRMNPAGISYLYLAEEPQTALVEVRPTAESEIVVAEFELTRELHILDLTDLSGPASKPITDEDQRAREDLKPFLEKFVEAISSPANQDGREHIDYVPSQIVCEYFAQVHSLDGEKDPEGDLSMRWPRIHGIRYPSTLRSGGINVVLFPGMPSDTDGDFEDWVARTERPLEFHGFKSKPKRSA